MSVAHASSQHQLQLIYQSHHSWLYGWLRKKLGNSFDAADLAHDTFMRIMAARSAPDIADPRAYLTTIAKGLLVNKYQRQALESAYLQALSLMPEPTVPSPEQQLQILQTLHQIDAALHVLPPQVQRAFFLSQLDGLRYEEIATQLKVSLITVKRYMKQSFAACLACMD